MEKTKMKEIVETMAEHICDQLCRYPRDITDTEDLDRQCGGCQIGEHLCAILNAYNSMITFEDSQCERLLEDLRQERQKHKWISVAERLPEDEQEVLCTDGHHVYLVEYDGEDFDYVDIIAWMPLPVPYRPPVLMDSAKRAGEFTDQPVLQSAT